ncbi:aldose 1-epimerase family protein, partial [[Clostridium] dakarense]|uniref:aldose 1-epimerase family protein n=1 Tax=Faecalimicrobium dakarense TaxID=1301100 RepID=UPI0005A64C20
MNKLQNDYLIIESKKSGAELTRIYSKKQSKDILWSGDSKFWGRQSPVLFPIVGKLIDNKTTIECNTYSMNQHGFARDLEFEILDTSDNSISYILKSNDDIKKLYPYSFELIIKYTLVKSSINIEWTVKNTDCKDIYFSIGAHPAFNVPMNNNESIEDYYLEFKHRNNVAKIELNGPFSDKSINLGSIEKIELSPDLFKNDALIYTNIDEISIHSNNSSNFIKVDFKEFPLVGIWTPYYKDDNSTAPFICIEPWYGLADNINSNGHYKDKDYINKLNIGETFKTSYSIS